MNYKILNLMIVSNNSQACYTSSGSYDNKSGINVAIARTNWREYRAYNKLWFIKPTK